MSRTIRGIEFDTDEVGEITDIRRKSLVLSQNDEFPVGPKSALRLIKHFGSYEEVFGHSEEEYREISGVGSTYAEQYEDAFDREPPEVPEPVTSTEFPPYDNGEFDVTVAEFVEQKFIEEMGLDPEEYGEGNTRTDAIMDAMETISLGESLDEEQLRDLGEAAKEDDE